MIVDAAFASAVRELADARMGTEHVGPLLYSLIRAVRPRRVVEIGMGYTTCFILRALADNVADFEAERRDLSLLPFPHPDHYREDHVPRLVAIDNLEHPASLAERAIAVATDLDLDRYLRVWRRDLHGSSEAFAAEDLPIDLLWLDAGRYRTFTAVAREYWPLLAADGGLWMIHSTLTNLEGQAFLRELKLRQATVAFNDYELVSLLEPHKLAQNSVTLVRKISGELERIYTPMP
ncbi:MAG: class I SAM-dependent methyltransferase [Myxococcales bacterium]|nr:class I SAM-dependent methyltransferase [Myxococcales bacterium]